MRKKKNQRRDKNPLILNPLIWVIRLPLRYKEKEFDIRKILNDNIIRGKVDCFINFELLDNSTEVKVNKPLIMAYMDTLKECAGDGPDFEYLKMAVRMPEAISSKPEELQEEEWEFLLQVIKRGD